MFGKVRSILSNIYIVPRGSSVLRGRLQIIYSSPISFNKRQQSIHIAPARISI